MSYNEKKWNEKKKKERLEQTVKTKAKKLTKETDPSEEKPPKNGG